MEEEKKKSIWGVLLLVIVLVAFVIIPIAKMMTMHKKMKDIELPEYAEVVLEPKIGSFSCSCGDRTNIEMVFKAPMEKMNEIGGGVIEKSDSYEITVDQFFEKDRLNAPVERDCTYVYSEEYAAKYDLPTNDEEYVYYHIVVKRKESSLLDKLIPIYDNLF